MTRGKSSNAAPIPPARHEPAPEVREMGLKSAQRALCAPFPHFPFLYLFMEGKPMRQTKDDVNLTMRAFAGTHVVLLGWSMTKLKSRRVLGFAFRMVRAMDGEALWLK